MKKTRLLINLPPTFFTVPQLRPYLNRLRKLATVRTRSYNTPEEILPDLKWADVVLMWSWPQISDAMLDQCPQVTYIGQLSATQQQARVCLKRNLPLSDTRHAWSPSVSEMALTLMLAGLRQTSAYHTAMRAGTEKWVNDFPSDIDPLERQLAGRTVGIAGFGRIGQRLAELLAPFHVKLLIYDPFLPVAVAKQYNAQPVPVLQLARESEVLVLCAANTKQSEHLLNRKAVMALRKNSVLVNVGRSSLVDMPALLERLKRNDMVAMLDVFDKEPLEADSPLRKLPNAFLTPHRAGGLYSSLERGLTMLTDDLVAHLNGQPRRYNVTGKILPSLPD